MDTGVKISLVAAMAEESRVIGNKGKLPWKLSDDLKHLRKLTLGKTIILGRKTEESIIARIGHSLPDRRTIVLTRSSDYKREDCEVAHDWEEAIDLAKGEKEVFILGGSEIYKQALPLANKIYLTIVKADVAGDAFFPKLHSDWNWKLEEEHHKDEKNEYDFERWTLTRKEAPTS